MNADRPDTTHARDSAAIVTLWSNLTDLNSLWRTSPSSVQSIYVTKPLTDGVWETNLTRFGKIELIRTGEVRTEVHLYRRDETTVRVIKSSGIEAKQIVTVNGVKPLAGKLRVSLLHDKSWLRYNAATAGELSAEWTGPGSYAFYDPDYVTTPEGYEAYFDQLKKIAIGYFPPINNAQLQQLYIYTHVSATDDWPVHFSVHGQPVVYPTIVSAPQARSVNDPLTKTYVTALFPSRNFPEAAAGRAPAESQWLHQLVAPHGLLRVVGGTKDAGGWLAQYGAGADAVATAPTGSITANVDTLSPHARILSAGAAKEHVQFIGTPLPNAAWTLSGAARGRLVKEDNNYFYVPPLMLSPAATFNESGETLIPAAYRSSISGLPLVADVVQAANTSQTASSIFVTTFVKPTHYIRFASHTNGLQLNLCWIGRGGERQVPADKVKWHVLAGNGAVSAEGVFIPASGNPSAVTVLMAEDLQDQTEWRYGVIIIPLPLFTAPDLLRLQQD